MFAPDAEKRDAMVNFGIPPQPPAALSAPPTLDAPQQLNLATRRIPELPGDNASAMPDRVLVGAGVQRAIADFSPPLALASPTSCGPCP